LSSSNLFDVVPATRLRQGFAEVAVLGRRSLSEGGKRGPIRREDYDERRCSRLALFDQ
jgi:hypothetical protein